MKTGLGITTYQRPDYLRQSLDGVIEHLLDVVDVVYIYDDGSKKGVSAYKEIAKSLPDKIKFHRNPNNKGVAVAKNWLLKKLIEDECDYIFIGEDDIIPQSPKAITAYIKASKASGIEHFMFAHHGPANVGMLYKRTKGVDLYTACVGAWCMYTPEAIREAGYLDERMLNAFEHVEHSWRIAKKGYTTPMPLYPDVTGSKNYLKEIPGSIENSSIRARKDWIPNILKALLYWESKDKDFPLKTTLDKLLRKYS